MTVELEAYWLDWASLSMIEDGTITWSKDSSLDSGYVDDIDWAFSRLDANTAINFIEVAPGETAEIDLIGATGSGVNIGNYGGYASTNGNPDGWLIELRSGSSGSAEYERYLVLHEIGHALGMEHTFDSSDGDSITGSRDTTDTSVMSYSWGKEDITDFTAFDWAFINKHYGGSAPIEEVIEVETPVVEPEPEPEPELELEPQPEPEFVMPYGRGTKLDRHVRQGNLDKAIKVLDKVGFDDFYGVDLEALGAAETFSRKRSRVISTLSAEDHWEKLARKMNKWNRQNGGAWEGESHGAGCSCGNH